MKDVVRVGLRIPYELNTWLILEAEKRGLTKNGLVIQLLWNYFKERGINDLNCSSTSND